MATSDGAVSICFFTSVFAGEYVSLDELAPGEWTIALGPLTLGTYSEHTLTFTEALAWHPTTV